MLVDIANTILDLLRRPTGGHTSMPAECLARAWLTDISVTRIDSRKYIASCNTVMLSLCHALVGRNPILDLPRRPTGGYTSMPEEFFARNWLTDNISVARIDSHACMHGFMQYSDVLTVSCTCWKTYGTCLFFVGSCNVLIL